MDPGATNPIVPTWWDFSFGALGVLAVAVFVLALVSIVRSRISLTMKLICGLLVLAMPFIGSLVWFSSKKSLERSVAPPPIG